MAPRIKARWFDPLAESVDPITDLKHLFEQTMKQAAESGHLMQGCPLNNLAQEMSQLDEGLRQRILKVYAMWRNCCSTEDLRARNRSRQCRRGISPVDVAAFIVAALAGIIGTAKNSRSQELVRQAGEAFFGYLDSLRA